MKREEDRTGHYQVCRLRRQRDGSIICFFFSIWNRSQSEATTLTWHVNPRPSSVSLTMWAALKYWCIIMETFSAVALKKASNHPISSHHTWRTLFSRSVAREKKKKKPSIQRIRGGDRMFDGEAPINFMILCLRLPIEKNPLLIREPVGAVN